MAPSRDSQAAQYQKMTGTPVEQLVFRMSIPTVISMLVTNIYNLADTYFVSSIGTSASGAVGIVFALMAILQAVGFMMGHGAGSLISMKLGARDLPAARKLASTAFFTALALGVSVSLTGLLFLRPLMMLLGSTPTILPYASRYAVFILLAAPMMVTSCVMNNILRYEGKAAFAMVGLTFGGVLNIALDPLFIFGLKLGITGAGLATALSQTVSAGLLLSVFLRGKTQSTFRLRDLSRQPGDYLRIFRNGMPSLLRQGLNSIAAMLLNNAAAVYGDPAVAAMSIVGRASFLIFAVGIGIGQGLQPVSSFNYGAGRYSRVRRAYLFTLAYGTSVCAVLSTVGLLSADSIITAFRDDPAVIAIGVPALRAQCLASYLCVIFQSTNMLHQSVGRSNAATVLASLRNGVCFIPLILLLPRLLGITGVMWAQPCADFLASVVSIPFLLHFITTLPPDTPASP
ncbi:MAG: MATE family efflux transporter [Clostridia bacterium]|nr:MATE family efflux transporter [Clostridia bacterium]